MNTDPDLPEVPLFRKVTALAGVKPVKGFSDVGSDEKKRQRAAEMDFRKKLQGAIQALQEQEDRHDLAFEPVELDGEMVVAMVDAAGERIGMMSAEDAIARAESGAQTAFLIDREC